MSRIRSSSLRAASPIALSCWPSLADQDRLLAVAQDVDGLVDPHLAAVRRLGPALGLDRDAVGQLLVQAVEDLLAGDLGRQRPVREVGELVLGKQPRALGQLARRRGQQVVAAVAVEGRDDEGGGEGVCARLTSAISGRACSGRDGVELVDHEERPPPLADQLAQRQAGSWRRGPCARRARAERGRRRRSRPSAALTMAVSSRRFGAKMPGVSTNMIWVCAHDRDADHAPAGGLHLGRDDRDLGADQAVEQGRLADVGRADDGDEARAGRAAGSAHRRVLADAAAAARPAAACSAARLVAGRAACGRADRPTATSTVKVMACAGPLGRDHPIGRAGQAARLGPFLQRRSWRRAAESAVGDRTGRPVRAARSAGRPRSRRRDRWRRSAPRSSRRAWPAAAAARSASLRADPQPAPEPEPLARPRPGSPCGPAPPAAASAAPSASSGKRSISRCGHDQPSTRSPRNSSRS